jgi:hypothetical protein
MELLIGGLDVVKRCIMLPSSNMTSFETKPSLLPWTKKHLYPLIKYGILRVHMYLLDFGDNLDLEVLM